ncbi:PQQ-binding-like beta-propeller repeat protein, partial [bacterium]|nr:PQQ-binding-like beta-propeller repeat protein [bacterium]
WSLETQVRATESSPAVGDGGNIYFGSGTNFYALNPEGSEIWIFKTAGSISNSPAIDDNGTIYVGSEDQNLYAINSNGTEKWRFKTEWDVFSSPAIGDDGTIYFGGGRLNIYSDGKIYQGPQLFALNPDGSEQWRFLTGYNIKSSPIIGADGTLYIGSWVFDPAQGGYMNYGYLYAVNPDGTEKWRYETSAAVDTIPIIDSDGTIYFSAFYVPTPKEYTCESCFYAVSDINQVSLDLHLYPPQQSFKENDNIKLLLDIQTSSKRMMVDIYFALFNITTKNLFFAKGWRKIPAQAVRNLELPPELSLKDVFLYDFPIPCIKPPIEIPGMFSFAIVATESDTYNLISNIAFCTFETIENK